MNEQAAVCGDLSSLVGILTRPEQPVEGAPALLVLTAGRIHRVGPNHMYAELCRDAAAAGFFAMRFDFSGIGDSEPRKDFLPFHKSCVLEVQQAMDYLRRTANVERFVLVGLCSGANAAYFAALEDRRVVGGILINTQSFQEEGEDELLDYAAGSALTRYLFSPRAWVKVFKGTARYRGKLGKVAKHLTASLLRKNRLSDKARAASQGLFDLAERNVELLLLYSRGDRGLEYFNLLGRREITRLEQTGRVQIEILNGTDHLFTPPEPRQELFRISLAWLQRFPQRKKESHPLAAALSLCLSLIESV
jgi:pimeloyl-ACP methyl ester carboxylesterase